MRSGSASAQSRSIPEFGNPYNDIGAYLIEKGQLDEAIGWLEKAKTAERYEPRHFPFMNLGRIYAAKGMVISAQSKNSKAHLNDTRKNRRACRCSRSCARC